MATDEKNGDEQELVEVYRPANAYSVAPLQEILAEHGIEAATSGESLQQGAGELPMGWSTAPRIFVRAADADRAREILDQADAQRVEIQRNANYPLSAENLCLSCGAEMLLDACPSCGWSFREEDADDEPDERSEQNESPGPAFVPMIVGAAALVFGAIAAVHRIAIVTQYPNWVIAKEKRGEGKLRDKWLYVYTIEGTEYALHDSQNKADGFLALIRYGDDPDDAIFDQGFELPTCVFIFIIGGMLLGWGIGTTESRRQNARAKTESYTGGSTQISP